MFTDAEVANLERVLIAGRLRTDRGFCFWYNENVFTPKMSRRRDRRFFIQACLNAVPTIKAISDIL